MNPSALLLSFLLYPAFAQTGSLNVAYPITLKGLPNQSIKTGLIVSLKDDGYYLSQKPYDKDIQGVINLNPGVEFLDSSKDNSVPLVKTGSAYVLVSGENGNVSAGDYITSSTTPGVGIKALNSGMVLGTVLEDTNFKSNIDLVLVELGPRQYEKDIISTVINVVKPFTYSIYFLYGIFLLVLAYLLFLINRIKRKPLP